MHNSKPPVACISNVRLSIRKRTDTGDCVDAFANFCVFQLRNRIERMKQSRQFFSMKLVNSIDPVKTVLPRRHAATVMSGQSICSLPPLMKIRSKQFAQSEFDNGGVDVSNCPFSTKSKSGSCLCVSPFPRHPSHPPLDDFETNFYLFDCHSDRSEKEAEINGDDETRC